MIAVLSYNRVAREQEIIEKGCRSEVAKRADERLVFTKAASMTDLSVENARPALSDILYCEVQNRGDVEGLKRLREKEAGALLMLIASAGLSPMQYLKPGISPDMLLLRPFGQADFDAVNEELFDALFLTRNAQDSDEHFVLHSRDGRTLIPYGKISFFEACNKKINLRAGSEEYDFYDSIENILRTVPGYFVRCHRAYLVNVKKIRKMNVSEGLLELDGGALVPLSRTYKQRIKEMIG